MTNEKLIYQEYDCEVRYFLTEIKNKLFFNNLYVDWSYYVKNNQLIMTLETADRILLSDLL